MQAAAGGLVEHLRQQYFSVTPQCRADVPAKTNVQAIKLVHLAVSFVILGIGLSLSTLAFLIEVTQRVANI